MAVFSRLKDIFFKSDTDSTVRNAIEDLIEDQGPADSSLAPDEKNMLANILKLRDLTVEDVMLPRAEIIAVPDGMALDELLKIFKTKAVMRLPVYRDDLDDVIGYVHVSDLLGLESSPFQLMDHVRKIDVVPQSMGVLDLLLKMRSTGEKIALVVDEYGGIDGLVTIGDIVEEIVGDIQDVTALGETPALFRRSDGVLVADARMDIEEFEKTFGPILTDKEREEDIDTLGGLVCDLVTRVPQRGELIKHSSGIEFEVIDADPRRIKRVGIHGAKN